MLFEARKVAGCPTFTKESSGSQAYLLLVNQIWVTSWTFHKTADCDVMSHDSFMLLE